MHPLTVYLAAQLREQLRNPYKPRPEQTPRLSLWPRCLKRLCHRERLKRKAARP